MPQASSFHSVECLLENFDIARATNLFSGGFNPLLFESVFSRTIGFVENAEHSGERKLREFVRCELVSDVVPQILKISSNLHAATAGRFRQPNDVGRREQRD